VLPALGREDRAPRRVQVRAHVSPLPLGIREVVDTVVPGRLLVARALGELERVLADPVTRAHPAVDGIYMRELSNVVFTRPTESREGALTADGERRRQQLGAVMAPIVASPRPPKLDLRRERGTDL
jgi:hypothetical protein